MRSHLTGAVISLRFWRVYHKPLSEIQKGAFSVKKQKSISGDALFLSRVDKKDATVSLIKLPDKLEFTLSI